MAEGKSFISSPLGPVRLSAFSASDASVLCAGDADPELRRRFAFPEAFVPSLEHSRAVIARWAEERSAGTRYTFAVRDVQSDALLGGCELLPRSPQVANLSYWTYAAHRNRGIATRAVAIAIKLSFEELSFEELELVIDHDNEASRKVAVRCGFTEASMRDGQLLYVARA